MNTNQKRMNVDHHFYLDISATRSHNLIEQCNASDASVQNRIYHSPCMEDSSASLVGR